MLQVCWRWLSSIQSGVVCAQMLVGTIPFELLFIIRAREAFRVTPAVTKVDSLLRAPSTTQQILYHREALQNRLHARTARAYRQLEFPSATR